MSLNQPTDMLAHLGPAPFHFVMEPAELSCPAFSRTFKSMATVLVSGCGAWLFDLWRAGVLGSGASSGLVWFLCGLALMAITYFYILTSTTTLNAQHIQQVWVWNKQFDLRELAYCKFIRIPGLDWLIAPRLYARNLSGKFAVFYASDPAMLSQFARLTRELTIFRQTH
jgi:hypothetical protein